MGQGVFPGRAVLLAQRPPSGSRRAFKQFLLVHREVPALRTPLQAQRRPTGARYRHTNPIETRPLWNVPQGLAAAQHEVDRLHDERLPRLRRPADDVHTRSELDPGRFSPGSQERESPDSKSAHARVPDSVPWCVNWNSTVQSSNRAFIRESSSKSASESNASTTHRARDFKLRVVRRNQVRHERARGVLRPEGESVLPRPSSYEPRAEHQQKSPLDIAPANEQLAGPQRQSRMQARRSSRVLRVHRQIVVLDQPLQIVHPRIRRHQDRQRTYTRLERAVEGRQPTLRHRGPTSAHRRSTVGGRRPACRPCAPSAPARSHSRRSSPPSRRWP